MLLFDQQMRRLASRRLFSATIAAVASTLLGAQVVGQIQSQIQSRVQIVGPNPTALREHPGVAYSTTPARDPIARLAEELAAGRVALSREGPTGYLQSVLAALRVPPQSQVLPFSKSSFQSKLIAARNPRALYFNDAVFVGYVRGSDVLEFASQDPKVGTVFYTLRQTDEAPKFERNNGCVICHAFEGTAYVPGPFVSSVYPDPDGLPLYGPTFTIDHRSPFDRRWGGWYVTGRHDGTRHMGNAVVTNPDDIDGMVTPATVKAERLDGRFDFAGYLSPQSDMVALLVLEHQTRMHSLMTRVGYDARIGGPPAWPLSQSVPMLVDYMLFVDEASLPGPIQGTTDFAQVFQSSGPKDGRGRSLRQLELRSRLLAYPCSFLIYSDSFRELPANGKQAVYARLWQVLSGQDRAPRYAKLTVPLRTAIVEILRDTVPDLPSAFDASAVR